MRKIFNPTLASVVLVSGMAIETIEYSIDGTIFQATLVSAKTEAAGELPGVLIVPNLWGPNDYWTAHAEVIAGLGYHAMVADMYSIELRPKTHEEAYGVIGPFKQNRMLVRERMQKALSVFKEQPGVDARRVAAIGYCFGGMCVLEVARSGNDVCGVVSLHGLLAADASGPLEAVKTKVLVLHGAEDPMVPDEQVAGFMKEMRAAKADWQLVHFGGAVHAFTDKNANRPGEALYDETVDKRSFLMMTNFLSEVL